MLWRAIRVVIGIVSIAFGFVIVGAPLQITAARQMSLVERVHAPVRLERALLFVKLLAELARWIHFVHARVPIPLVAVGIARAAELVGIDVGRRKIGLLA